jgi:RNA recognition motif-containing protein
MPNRYPVSQPSKRMFIRLFRVCRAGWLGHLSPGVTNKQEFVMNIFVGNLPRTATEEELRKAFEPFGEIASVAIIKDKFSGESRGFGFVEMPDEAAAKAAIAGLNGKPMGGRNLTVNQARPKTEGGGGGGRRYGGDSGGRRW